MIINIRGTSGSGKTTLMKHFFSMCDSVEEIFGYSKKKAEANRCIYKGQEVIVLGSYANLCGGCDGIPSQDKIHELLDDYSFDGTHVIFEGLFISHIYGRYAEKASADPDNWVFFMLETDFDLCMDHIRERRVKQGKDTELKDTVYKNARKTYDSTYRIRDKLTRDKLTWEELPMKDRFKQFEELLDFYLC